MEVRYIEIKTSPAGQIIRAYTPEQYKKEMARRKNATARARKLTRLQERVGAVLAMLGLLNIVWGCNYFSYEFAPGRIVWDKCKKGTSFSDCELAATDLFNTVRLFRFMWNGMLQGKSVAEGHIMQGNKKLNEQRIHPTQKPVALYDWIFQNYAAPGCRVLDTHLGSGSSRIAAYEAGVDFIGFEIDPIYYAAEEQRFLDYTSQTSLFHLT